MGMAMGVQVVVAPRIAPSRHDLLDCIKMIYNPRHLQDFNTQMSPVEFEKYCGMNRGSVWKTRGDSVYSFLKLELVLDCAELCCS